MTKESTTARRAVAVGSCVVLGLLAACATSDSKETTTEEDDVQSEPDAGAAVTDGTDDVEDAGTVSEPDPVVDAGPPPEDCSSFAPLAVDTAFLATGWMGEAPTAVLFVDCAGTRATPSALGNCHTVTYAVPAMDSMGWAGISWQNPQDYWEDPPAPFVGYPMPCGATKIVFYAKGEVGGEKVDFWGGNAAYQAKKSGVALSTEWTRIEMPFAGTPDDNVTLGFGWAMGAEAAGGPGQTAIFHLDDIHWE